MIEHAQDVLSLTRSKSELVYLSLPQDDPTQWRPDITKARELRDDRGLNVPLHEGLKHTIDYFRGLRP